VIVGVAIMMWRRDTGPGRPGIDGPAKGMAHA
jgi:hypothetical protein